MTRTRAQVREGVLTFHEGGLDQMVPVGSSSWERWLEQPSSTAFRFEHGAARFTARRELQRGRWYWYAYRRLGGWLRKAYLQRRRLPVTAQTEARREAGSRAHRQIGRRTDRVRTAGVIQTVLLIAIGVVLLLLVALAPGNVLAAALGLVPVAMVVASLGTLLGGWLRSDAVSGVLTLFIAACAS